MVLAYIVAIIAINTLLFELLLSRPMMTIILFEEY